MTNHLIAEKSGVPEPTLEKIFSGATRKPGINTVIDIIHAMGGTLDSIDPVAQTRGIKKSSSSAEAAPGDIHELTPMMTALYTAMNQLNDQGQEKVLEYADDLVSSGKYIKSNSSGLGKAQGA